MKIKTVLIEIVAAMALGLGVNSANAADLIVRYPDGSPIQASWSVAMQACPAGMRLPTARELAKWAASRGAKGILEVNQVDPRATPAGYQLISVVDPDGKNDSFFYSYEGYESTIEKHQKYDFWTSSSRPDNQYDAAQLTYFGMIYNYTKSGFGSVLCLP